MGILTGYFEKRSAISTLANPQQWLRDWFGGGLVSSGISVNESSALTATAVYACVRIISETIASLPLHVFQKQDGGGKIRSPDHALYSVLHDVGNDWMTAFTLRETLTAHSLTWGAHYAEIERNGAGKVVALWPLRPDRTYPWLDPRTRKLSYRTQLPDGTQVELPFERVLHTPGLGYDGIVSYSPIRMAREAIGLSMATEQYGATWFGNGAKPSGVLTHPGSLTDNARTNMRQSWEKMHKGLEKSHRVAILEEGVTYTQIGLPPEDSQFLQTRKFQLQEIARIFRVPPHMLADLERSTNNNIEHQSIEFVTHTLRPWLVRLEQSYNFRLLTPIERKKYFCEHAVQALMRGDYKSRQEGLAVMKQNGVINANEWREEEGINPIAGDEGSVYLVNSALTGPLEAAKGVNNNGQGNAGASSSGTGSQGGQ